MQSVSKHYLHAIFATKRRRPSLPVRIDEPLHEYMGGIFRGRKCRLLEAGGGSDHRHVLFELHADQSLSELIRAVKAGSSRWLRKQLGNWDGWQNGYGAFSVCERHLISVAEYIRNQREHHEEQTLRAELGRLLGA